MRGHSEAQEVKLGLKYPGEWKFGTTESADAVPADAVDEFFALTVQIASSADSPKSVLELFKSTFASFHGRSYSSSSSYEWAESDLSSLMHECAERSPTFIDAYWTSISKMEQTGVPAPGVEYLNSILTKYGIPYVIDPPKLLRAQGDAILLKVAEQAYNSASPRTSLERYLLVSELGHGGFGRVYHAKRTTSVGTFNFAIKILDPSPFVQNRETAKARFCREVETLQRLHFSRENHHIVAQHADLAVAPDQTVRHHSPGHIAHLADAEYIAHLRPALIDFLENRFQHTGHSALQLIGQFIDDGVQADVHLLLFR